MPSNRHVATISPARRLLDVLVGGLLLSWSSTDTSIEAVLKPVQLVERIS